jgi:glycosyltransferase involved in cell wall biosynthesis
LPVPPLVLAFERRCLARCLPAMTPAPPPPVRGARVGVLVTIPVRNEVDRLVDTLRQLDAAFRAADMDFQLSVAEDGSTDGTKELLSELHREFPGLIVQAEPTPLGRGRALRQLWSKVEADVYCFTDTDLAAGPESLVATVRAVQAGHPIAIGSRYAPGAEFHRPPLRAIVSRGYNQFLRSAFHEKIRDHQCGLKAFGHDALRCLLPITKEDSWFWDSEILIVALRNRIPVLEMPVDWTEKKVSRTHWQRLASDIMLHGVGILRLKARIDVLAPIGATLSRPMARDGRSGTDVPGYSADT